MAAPNSDRDRPPTNDEPVNPFVAFRRFADSQMSSLVNNVFGIFQSSPIRRQQAIDDYESMLKESRESRQKGSESQAQTDCEAEDRRDLMELYLKAMQDNEDDARRTGPLHKDDSDDILEGMKCPYPRPLDHIFPPLSIDLAYLWTSSYSPLALEQKDVFREHSGRMRAAFADLMAMQKCQKLISDNTIERHAQMTPPGWATSMGRMMVSDGDGLWLDWEKPGLLDFTWLLSTLGRSADLKNKERREGGGDDSKDSDDELDLQGPFLPGSRICEFIKSAARDVLLAEEERKALDEKAETMLADAGFVDEAGVGYTDSACTCLHCRNYERRREEFRQWRREELEENEAEDNEDAERTTNPTSELDQYHALADHQAYLLMHEQQRKAQSESNTAKNAKFDKQTTSDDKPSILSTLTTTEQRKLPDGTVTTKVVLKKRFSDGGEEVTEKMHTQNAPLPQKPAGAETSTSQDPAARNQNNHQKGGWFWS